MKTITQYGITTEYAYFLGNQKSFYIQRLDGDVPDKYIYPGDSIKYELDAQLTVLYDTFRDVFFPDLALYYSELASLPILLQCAGQDSEFTCSSEMFQELILYAESQNFPDLYRHLYLVDCQFMIGTIQNLLIGMEDAFINYFEKISTINLKVNPEEQDATFIVRSGETISISGLLENYFIKAYSILDLLCKIAFELQSPETEFRIYKKLKSAKVLWGERKNLIINDTPGTVFEKDDLIRTIESIRNEVVHNGTWELNPKAFLRYDNGQIVERYMFFPDIYQGRLAAVKNRRHFFGDERKVNELLPQIHKVFRARILNTVNVLNHRTAERLE